MRFEDHIAALGGAVDRILDHLPDNLLEARRTVERELRIEISAEELHTIKRMAEVQEDQPLVRDLPRRLLTLKVLVERQLHNFWNDSDMDVLLIRDSADQLTRSLGALERIEQGFRSILDAEGLLSDGEKEFLEQVCASFRVPRESIDSALLLAPQLVGLLGVHHPEPSRHALEATTLQLAVEEDLTAWFQADADATAHAELIDRLGQQLEAIKLVSQRLERQAEQARREDDAELADRLEGLREGLGLLREELTPIVRQDGEEVVEEEEVDETERLLAESEALEKASERETAEELERLREIKVTRKVATKRAEVRRIGRKRLATLCIAAALSLLAAGKFHLNRDRPQRPIAVSTMDFSHVLLLSEVRPVGRMLYARASFDDFEDRQQLLESMARVGRIALDMGFHQVYLVDPNGEPVATWTRGEGPELHRRL